MVLFTVDSQNTLGKSVKEAGSYNVIILPDSECKQTKQTQNDMAVLNYEVIDGAYKGGKILYDNIVWDAQDVSLSAKRFNTLLTSAGVPDGTKIDSIEQVVNGLKGKQLNITVDWKHSEYNDRWNLIVKGYQKTDPEGSKPNGVKRPDHNQQAQNNQKSAPQQQSFQGVDPFNGITDDDLPF